MVSIHPWRNARGNDMDGCVLWAAFFVKLVVPPDHNPPSTVASGALVLSLVPGSVGTLFGHAFRGLLLGVAFIGLYLLFIWIGVSAGWFSIDC